MFPAGQILTTHSQSFAHSLASNRCYVTSIQSFHTTFTALLEHMLDFCSRLETLTCPFVFEDDDQLAWVCLEVCTCLHVYTHLLSSRSVQGALSFVTFKIFYCSAQSLATRSRAFHTPLRQIHRTRTLRKRAYERSILFSLLTDISRAWQRTPRTMKRLARLHTPGALGPSLHRDLLSEPLLHLFPRHLTTPIQFLCTPR